MQHIGTSPLEHLHPWLRSVAVYFAPGQMTPLLEAAAADLLEAFQALGHTIQHHPDEGTDLILSTAPFDRPLNWRSAALFTARRRFGLSHTPNVITLVHARPAEFEALLAHFEAALARQPRDPADFAFDGLAPSAFETLVEQGTRGGPILALERLLQVRTKSIRILLLVGEQAPQSAYLFDLVGAHPRVEMTAGAGFYQDLALRIVTILSTREVTEHEVTGDPIPADLWERLPSPAAMLTAARELGRRGFFTRMVRIADLANVPAIGDAIASQYSEGCFATWEPELNALIATVTGSARPVEKDHITRDDLAVISGLRPDGQGVFVRDVENARNDPPSSEAVELMAMDEPLPRITLDIRRNGSTSPVQVPVLRSKLHGHRGVRAYHPDFVEFAPLDLPYHLYPVSCATQAQALGIRGAFSRAASLLDPQDPRQLAFTILPGHGVMLVEKWRRDKQPFQLLWEYMDLGYIQIEPSIPQGLFTYELGPDGLRHLQVPG